MIMTTAISKNFSGEDLDDGLNQAEAFRSLAMRYTKIAANEGIRVIPFLSPEMPLFQQATQEARKNAVNLLEMIVTIHEETLAGGDRAIHSKKLLWRALGKLSLIPGPDVFDVLSDEDVVLIYNENHTALFWNLQFFNFTSLTVEHLFFSQWYEFTKRDLTIQQALQEMAYKVVTGQITGTFNPNIPGHEVEELETQECIRTWMELPVGSVLTKKGNFGGVLMVQKMRVLS
jgi:hypothetical protein